MKWKNPDHEFDHIYKAMQGKNEFYFFGAGDYGKQFIHIMSNEIVIKGFIDNNLQKQGIEFTGYKCESLGAIDFIPGKTGIVITVSQIQRGAIIKQLQDEGYVRDQDFFIIEEFLSIYFVYKYNQVYFSSISFLPSTVCNLKCKACLNFNSYAKQFYVRELEDIKKDIDLFFQCVDRIMLFHVSGGEPMLYKGIADIIEYIDKNYGDRIDTLRTVTNGTVVPNDVILERLSKCNFEITVDDYREAVPQYNDKFDKLLTKLEQYHIHYYINKTDEWIDLAPDRTDFSKCSEGQMQQHFDECCQAWQELREGKLYSCNYDAYATVAGINEEPDEEVFDLKNFSDSRKKALVEFRLGYNGKGFTNFCKKCRGFSEQNPYKGQPAKQVE
jgi:hypothetical protein